MKASLVVEVIGGDIRGSTYWKARRNHRLRATPDQTWVAELAADGRRFLDYKTDYRNANSVASRGVERHYVLESGKLYEVQRRVSERGDIERIELDG